jgi:2-polyprenyl-3-methyl-5-hydroxy-6-metoxy-1,4-benzoquinol methylase
MKIYNFRQEMIQFIDKCPLCGNSSLNICDTITTDVLQQLWKKLYKIEFTGLDNNIEIKLIKCVNCDLLYYTPQLLADGRLYDLLQEDKKYYVQDKSEFLTAFNFITPNDNVLEIGAGDGAFSRKLQCKSYVGLELSKEAIMKAIKLDTQSNKLLLEENIEPHAINNPEKYDVVCLFQVLEHVSQITMFLKASIDCLKKGGKLILSVPSEDSWLAYERNNILNAPPHHLTRWTTDCLTKLPDLVNLKLVKIEQDRLSDHDIGNYSVWLVQNMICKLLRIQQRTMDYRFAVNPVRNTIRLLAYLFRIVIKVSKSRPIGHSVTAIYEK